jgi:hypothetical protein
MRIKSFRHSICFACQFVNHKSYYLLTLSILNYLLLLDHLFLLTLLYIIFSLQSLFPRVFSARMVWAGTRSGLG